MAEVTPADVASFRADGYVLIRDVLDGEQLRRGRDLAAALLAAAPPDPGHVGFYFLWPRLRPGGHPLLDFYRQTGVGRLAAGLLRPDLAVTEPDYAQLATTIPPWPHRPGAPHIDGITPPEPDGRPGTFSLLCGVWLSDLSGPDRGNLWVWPGSHLRSGAWLAHRGADALVRPELLGPGPYPPVALGEPVQLCGPAGSVLFAHYLLGHNIGGHSGPAGSPPRQVVYYRLEAAGHRDRWREAVSAPLAEFRAAPAVSAALWGLPLADRPLEVSRGGRSGSARSPGHRPIGTCWPCRRAARWTAPSRTSRAAPCCRCRDRARRWVPRGCTAA
jgi:hypothetical protein